MAYFSNERYACLQEGISKWRVRASYSQDAISKTVGSYRREAWLPIIEDRTWQTFLYREIGEDEKEYILPPDWWPEPIPEGHLKLLNSMYGTTRAARRWHIHILDLMEQEGHLVQL